ncbi:MAG: YdcF family protein [Hyphomicrobiales bacterium]|nr:YdcF family protein [Hyphomicrobiales bacterium]
MAAGEGHSAGQQQPARRRRRALPLLAAVLGVAGFLITAGFMLFAARVVHFATTPAARPAPQVDGIVILTGGERRILEGLKVFEESRAKRLLISGVNRQVTRDDIRRISPLPQVLFECCIDIGYAAQDTMGNAVEARDWAKTWSFRRVLVVTSSYHMPRSLIELQRAMPSSTLIAYPVPGRSARSGPWWLDPAAFRQVAIEYAKFIPAAARLVADRARTLAG